MVNPNQFWNTAQRTRINKNIKPLQKGEIIPIWSHQNVILVRDFMSEQQIPMMDFWSSPFPPAFRWCYRGKLTLQQQASSRRWQLLWAVWILYVAKTTNTYLCSASGQEPVSLLMVKTELCSFWVCWRSTWPPRCSERSCGFSERYHLDFFCGEVRMKPERWIALLWVGSCTCSNTRTAL